MRKISPSEKVSCNTWQMLHAEAVLFQQTERAFGQSKMNCRENPSSTTSTRHNFSPSSDRLSQNRLIHCGGRARARVTATAPHARAPIEYESGFNVFGRRVALARAKWPRRLGAAKGEAMPTSSQVSSPPPCQIRSDSPLLPSPSPCKIWVHSD